jgi:hypothetical protein
LPTMCKDLGSISMEQKLENFFCKTSF